MQRDTDKLLTWASVIDEGTLAQARLASTLPFVTPHIALMPDAHLGMGATVGSVIPTLGAIIPAAVGVDIGCGMQAARLGIVRSDLGDLRRLRGGIERNIPRGIGRQGENTEITESAESRIVALERDDNDYRWREQLGTLGAGNHFLEISEDDEGFIWCFLHSGSRGIGNKTAESFIKGAKALMQRWFIDLPDPDLAFFPVGESEFRDYIQSVLWLQQYASANRHEMMDRMLTAIWRQIGGEIEPLERIDCHHNYTAQEHHMGRDLWITRKGAIRARQGDVGLIPGSMGTASYVVEGKGNVPSLMSAPHGAGRLMSRRQAKNSIDINAVKEMMAGIEANIHEGVLDEAPQAYKDIDQVLADAADLVEVKRVLRPILNIKG